MKVSSHISHWKWHHSTDDTQHATRLPLYV